MNREPIVPKSALSHSSPTYLTPESQRERERDRYRDRERERERETEWACGLNDFYPTPERQRGN